MEEVYRYIAHIRLVHFTVSLLSGALCYAGLTAGEEFPAMISEARSLKRFVEECERGFDPDRSASVELRAINAPWYSEWEAQLEQAWDGPRGVRFRSGALKNAYRVLPQSASSRQAISSTGTLRAIADWVGSYEVSVERLGPNHEDGVRFRRGTDGSAPSVTNVDVAWLGKNQATVRLDLLLYVNSPAGASAVVEHLEFSVETVTELVAPDPHWRAQKFRTLDAYWGEFSLLTIDELLAVLSGRLGDSLDEAGRVPFSFLGLQVRGKHIGYIGPAVTLLTLVYLFLYVGELHRGIKKLDNPVLFAPSWIGIMDTPIARFACFTSVVAMPSFGVGIVVYRFVAPQVSSLALAIPIAVVGFFVYAVSVDTARELSFERSEV